MSETALPPLTPPAKLPVIATAKASWRVAIQAVVAMPALAAATIAALVLLAAVDVDQSPKTLEASLAMLPGQLLRLAILTPLQIAVCRFVLRYQAVPDLPLGGRLRRALIFFCYSVLVSLPIFILLVIPLAGGEDDVADAAALFWFALFLLLIPVLVSLVVRTTILFPAIAVDAPDATFLNAMRDTKGRFWNMFFIAFWVLGPLIFILLIESAQREFFPLGFFQTIFVLKAAKDALIDVLLGVAGAAMSCFVYLAFADRLGRPGNLAPAEHG